MSNGPLRIEQYETVRYDINCNPLGQRDTRDHGKYQRGRSLS